VRICRNHLNNAKHNFVSKLLPRPKNQQLQLHKHTPKYYNLKKESRFLPSSKNKTTYKLHFVAQLTNTPQDVTKQPQQESL